MFYIGSESSNDRHYLESLCYFVSMETVKATFVLILGFDIPSIVGLPWQ